jgi:Zn finger protein HypA/HybF involved in hydrogenase expression
MGVIKIVKCRNCGKRWQRHEGGGFRGEIYYCNKCGKEQLQRHKFQTILLCDCDETKQPQSHNHKPQIIEVCDCGGKYEMNSEKIICPDCHSQNIRIKNDFYALWD